MSKRMKRLDEDILENRIIVSLIVLAVIVIVAIAYIWISSSVKNKSNVDTDIAKNSNSKETENKNSNSESASSSIGKTVEESEAQNKQDTSPKLDLNDSNSYNSADTSNSSETSSNDISADTQVSNNDTQEQTQPSFIMPVAGDIIKGFSKENLVFSNTLQEWVTHQALDIKANSRDVVKCAADGTVKSIKNDPRYGLTVIVEHSAGFITVYSNLLTSEYVVEGEQVKQGQTLGTVGSSAVFEIADETHLHFEMLLNSEYVDPSIYIK